ncbi:hypothetical protein Naga_100531g2, partial [Nannochloropsis gaditana]
MQHSDIVTPRRQPRFLTSCPRSFSALSTPRHQPIVRKFSGIKCCLFLLCSLPLMVPVRTQFPGPETVGPGSDFWNQTYDIDGRPVTLSQISSALNQSRPHYFWGGDLVCYDANMACCPAYCCNVMSTVHDLQKPMDMSFRDYQTASLNGTFQVLSWGESPLPEGQGGGQGGRDDKGSGAFVGILFKTFEFPIYGGWTLEIHFNKPVFDLRSFNARIVGTGDGAKTYFMQPEYWWV